jgi:16S rRNA (cytosine967-C5)-methyltransferase
MLPSQLQIAKQLVKDYQSTIPFIVYLKNYFKLHKKFGSRDRRFITEACFAFFKVNSILVFDNEDAKWEAALFLAADPVEVFLKLIPLQWQNFAYKHFTEKLELVQNTYRFEERPIWNKYFKEYFSLEAFLKKPAYFFRTRNKLLVINNTEVALVPKLNTKWNTYTANTTKDIAAFGLINKEIIIQDIASQQVANFFPEFNQQEPISIWDVCCGAGGKSLLVADSYTQVHITATDVRKSILINYEKRMQQASFKNYETQLNIPLHFKNMGDKKFNLVIADVPCTGSGTWRRIPEAMYYFKEETIQKYQKQQQQIISQSIKHTAPGGYYLYITCSVFAAENQENVVFIEKRFPNFKKINEQIINAWPQGGDALFVALFINQL